MSKNATDAPRPLPIPAALARTDYWTVRDACAMYAISRTSLYGAFQAGAPREKIGFRTLIPPQEFHDWCCQHRPHWVAPFLRKD